MWKRLRRLSESVRFRRALAIGALLSLAAVGLLIADAWVPLGKAPTGERLARVKTSPQWAGRKFANPEPMYNDVLGSVLSVTRMSAHAEPDAPLPVVRGERSRFATPPESGLRITWLGHSTMVIEIDGATFLTDPIFGGHASPFGWVGPRPWYPPPIPLAELPRIDAVLISHDHYDHLQTETIQAMAGWGTQFVVPLGVGAHLEYWGVPPQNVRDLDWWDRLEVAGVEVVATPSRHASGRQLLDQNRTLWAGFALIGPTHRAYFSGDTGLFPAMHEIGERLGPFDVTMIEVGAYDRAWPDWHLGPEQALRAHAMVRGEVFVPVHWGMMNLSTHGWTEPAERVLVEAERRGTVAYVPRPGESFEPAALPELHRWWPVLPWNTAEDDPIRATRVAPE